MGLTGAMPWVLLTILTIACGAGAAEKKQLVQAELLANVSAVQAGNPFAVGVRFKITAGWHIYWKNPGDSGAPTTVEFKVPEGFTVDALEFPAPFRFEQPGPIISFGYHDQVMLIATVTPPKQLLPGTKVAIAADADWLCCEKICVQGKAHLTLQLPVSESAQPANQELFEQWAQRMPLKTGQEKWVGNIVRGPDSSDAAAFAEIEWREPVTEVEWFAAEPDGFSIAESKAEAQGNNSRFSIKLSPQPKPAVAVTMVITFKDSQGVRRAIEEKLSVGLAKSEQSSKAP